MGGAGRPQLEGLWEGGVCTGGAVCKQEPVCGARGAWASPGGPQVWKLKVWLCMCLSPVKHIGVCEPRWSVASLEVATLGVP